VMDNTKPTRPRQKPAGVLQDAPGGLSAWQLGVKQALMEANDFAPHELVTFARALQWWDLADQLLQEATSLTGRERLARLKAAGDASTAALRHWRGLRFVDPARPAPRIGRPSGSRWDAPRVTDATRA